MRRRRLPEDGRRRTSPPVRTIPHAGPKSKTGGRLLSSVLRLLSSDIQKGGDPAAGSPTATLLRLPPSRWPYRGRLPPLRVGAPASGKTNSHGVTGGVYKA